MRGMRLLLLLCVISTAYQQQDRDQELVLQQVGELRLQETHDLQHTGDFNVHETIDHNLEHNQPEHRHHNHHKQDHNVLGNRDLKQDYTSKQDLNHQDQIDHVDVNLLAGQCHMISSIQNSVIQVMSAHYEFEKGIHGLHTMLDQTNQDIGDLKGQLLALEEKVTKGSPDKTSHHDNLQDDQVMQKMVHFFYGFMNEGLKSESWLKCHRLAPDFLHFVTNVSDALDFQQERADFLYRRLHNMRRKVRKMERILEPPEQYQEVVATPIRSSHLAKETDLLRKLVVQQQQENEVLKSRLLHLESTLKDLKTQQDQSRQSLHESQHLEDCPARFVRHQTSCYKFVNHTENWINAEKHCQSLHPLAHLAAMETKEEQDFLLMYRRHNAASWTSRYMWLGGSDMFQENAWVWVGTYTPLQYTNWLPGQPSNHGNEQHCIYFRAEGTDDRWDDWHCYAARMNFACEIVLHIS